MVGIFVFFSILFLGLSLDFGADPLAPNEFGDWAAGVATAVGLYFIVKTFRQGQEALRVQRAELKLLREEIEEGKELNRDLARASEEAANATRLLALEQRRANAIGMRDVTPRLLAQGDVSAWRDADSLLLRRRLYGTSISGISIGSIQIRELGSQLNEVRVIRSDPNFDAGAARIVGGEAACSSVRVSRYAIGEEGDVVTRYRFEFGHYFCEDVEGQNVWINGDDLWIEFRIEGFGEFQSSPLFGCCQIEITMSLSQSEFLEPPYGPHREQRNHECGVLVDCAEVRLGVPSSEEDSM